MLVLLTTTRPKEEVAVGETKKVCGKSPATVVVLVVAAKVPRLVKLPVIVSVVEATVTRSEDVAINTLPTLRAPVMVLRPLSVKLRAAKSDTPVPLMV